MRKRIPIERLRLGMHVHELCGSWIAHPFWRHAFLLDNPEDLQAIHASGIREVWIDTAKGLDVEDGAAEKIVAEANKIPAQADAIESRKQGIDTEQEAARALQICIKSRDAVTAMFQEARMGRALAAEDALSVVEEISSSVLRNPDALIGLVRLKDKDDYTYMHSVAVCALMVSLARQLGLEGEQVREAGMAGLLHDIGKMKIPLEILNKPGKLTDAEFDLVKTHSMEGYRILQGGNNISDIAKDVCLHHHEKVDGSGYPDRLKNEQIDLYAKMGAVCDVYDAITSNRPYRNGWEPSESIRRMAEWSAGHYDPVVFKAFVKSIGIYPVGSLVRLDSNRLGVVMEQTEKSLLTPRVKVFFSIRSNARIAPEILDLSRPSCKDKIISHEDPGAWDIPDINQLWSGLPTMYL
ncbi:MAG: HD-GYP domain-containing protein [Nitrosomonadales bacterium]|nr:HD-GYP domain-containing protein [Nitrosomonadales bacterium]